MFMAFSGINNSKFHQAKGKYGNLNITYRMKAASPSVADDSHWAIAARNLQRHLHMSLQRHLNKVHSSDTLGC